MARLRAERRALLAALLCAAARACEDSHGDCPSWTAQGECTANPGFMLDACCASCRAAGHGPRARARPSGGGGGGGAGGTPKKPARARDPLAKGAYRLRAGRLAGGGARFRPIREATLAVGAAATWCDEHAALQSAQGTSLTKAKACAGFSVELGADGAADPQTKERPVRRERSNMGAHCQRCGRRLSLRPLGTAAPPRRRHTLTLRHHR